MYIKESHIRKTYKQMSTTSHYIKTILFSNLKSEKETQNKNNNVKLIS